MLQDLDPGPAGRMGVRLVSPGGGEARCSGLPRSPRRAGVPASRSWGVMPGLPAARSSGPGSFQPIGPARRGQPACLDARARVSL